MFPEMRDGPSQAGTVDAGAVAEQALERLRELSVDLRAGAILGPGGDVLAASGDGEWRRGAAALWRAAEVRERPRPTQVHVATEAGEVFAVRTAATCAIAVAERFTLASLMFCDLRSLLREVEAGGTEACGAAG